MHAGRLEPHDCADVDGTPTTADAKSCNDKRLCCAIEAAGLIGIHDLIHGENVRAYVKSRDDGLRPTDAELIAFTRGRMGYKAPEEYVFFNALPLNATGKFNRLRLKPMAENWLAAGHAKIEPAGQIN